MLRTARDARMATERTNHAPAEVLDAWTTWYAEAITSAGRLRGPAR